MRVWEECGLLPGAYEPSDELLSNFLFPRINLNFL